jgi:hypothetical protein
VHTCVCDGQHICGQGSTAISMNVHENSSRMAIFLLGRLLVLPCCSAAFTEVTHLAGNAGRILGCQHSLLKHCSHRCAGGPGWEQDQRRLVASSSSSGALRNLALLILIEQVTDGVESWAPLGKDALHATRAWYISPRLPICRQRACMSTCVIRPRNHPSVSARARTYRRWRDAAHLDAAC